MNKPNYSKKNIASRHGVYDPGNSTQGMDDPAAFAHALSTYSVQELAKLANTSRRTLQYYDDIGLLRAERTGNKEYRRYDKEHLLRLQQILFFRELDFSLKEISKIMNSPQFDMRKALEDHRALIQIRRKRLDDLIRTIDGTIIRLQANKDKKMKNNNDAVSDEGLYSSFSKEEEKKYAAEAKERWGHTDAYKQSQERYGKMSDREKEKVAIDGDALMKEIARAFKAGDGATSESVQKLIARHYEGLRTFYDPNPEIYRGLAEMYVADERFTAFFDRYAHGLAPFMRDAMIVFADSVKQ